MRDRSLFENLPTVSLPVKFVEHWVTETLRIYELSEVLFRSLRYGDKCRPSVGGDDELVDHIKASLKSLWIEIEEVNDGRWEPRIWEVEDE